MTETLLVGDVGGTNVRFAEVSGQGSARRLAHFERFANDDYATFDAAVSAYLAKTGIRPAAACFAVAGPVRDGAVRLTNRNWQLSQAALERAFGFGRVRIINDFTAMARAVPEFAPNAFDTILEGMPIDGAPMIVTGPGTGLGVATLLRDAAGWRVLSGEGGHVAYAPRTALEFDIAAILVREAGYVSNELVCSGSGLAAVYAAFCQQFDRAREEISAQDMRQRADAGDEMFRALIEMRANCVMGAAGDLVLANGALGGVVLVGGVSERILDYLRAPGARERFVSRGPMRHYLEACPVSLLRNPEAPLIGAAAYFEGAPGA